MSEQLQVVIVGKDGISRIFAEVARNAKVTGDAVEKAGKEGAAGLRDIDAAAKTADRSLESVGRSATRSGADFDKFGAAAIAVGAGIAYAGNAALDQQQTIIGLQSAWGDAADEMIRFAEELSRPENSIFNDDDILRGERYFATLKNQYGLTLAEIQSLMRTTSDLASAAGTSFEDAANRVTAAIRNETEGAEYLGLTLNQQAIDRENLTLSMSNQEAAQFRLAALNDQAAAFAGTSERLAASEVGTRARLTNMIQDNTQALGAYIGPLGSMVGGTSLAIAGLAQMGVGFGSVVNGIRAATVAGRAFVATPLGLAITAVAGAAALASIALGRNGDSAAEAQAEYEELQSAVENTDAVIRNLNLNADFGLAAAVQRDLLEARAALTSFEGDLSGALDFGNASVEDGQSRIRGFLDATIGKNILQFAIEEGYFTSHSADQAAAQEWITQVLLGNETAINEATVVIQSAARDYYTEMLPDDGEKAEIEVQLGQLFDLYNNPNIDPTALGDRIGVLFEQMVQGGHDTIWLSDQLALLYQDITVGADTYDILADAINGATAAQREFNWMIDDLRLEGMDELADDLIRMNQLTVDLSGSELISAGTKTQVAAAQGRLNELVRSGNIDNDKLNAYLAGQLQLLHSGQISYQEYAESVIWAADNATYFTEVVDASTVALVAMQVATHAVSQGLTSELGPSLVTAALDLANLAVEAGATALALEVATAAMESAAAGASSGIRDATNDWDIFGGVVSSAANGIADSAAAGLVRLQELRDLLISISGIDSPLEEWNALGMGTESSQFAEDLIRSGEALDNIFRIIVGNTDAIASQAQGIADWADELIGVQGEWAVIDDLLNNGRISLENYNQAQAAQVEIAQSNAEIQQYIQQIQAQQAPLIAEQMEVQENYLETLSRRSEQEQLLALSWMDQVTAAKALEIQTLAVAVANGELGSSGEQAFTSMLQGIAATQPGLAAILEDMGLISIGADGTVTVHLDGAEGAMSDIEQLTFAIVNLIDLMDDDKLNGSFSIEAEDNATPVVENAVSNLRQADGDQADVTVNGDSTPAQNAIQAGLDALRNADGQQGWVHLYAEDNATGIINGARAALNAFKGQRATAYIDTVYRTFGSPSQDRYNLHGGIAGYALGGNVVPIWAGEAGPEIEHFAGGGSALIPHEGPWMARQGSYIEPANSVSARASISSPNGNGDVHLHIYGNVYGIDDLAGALEGAITQRRRGFGSKVPA